MKKTTHVDVVDLHLNVQCACPAIVIRNSLNAFNMCLVTDQICPIKARKDIEVYKILKYCTETNTIVTPFVHYPVLTKTMDTYKESIEPAHGIYHRLIIRKGMIHSYGTLPYLCGAEIVFVVKAIIPKGTLYYTSEAEGPNKEYASKKLILQGVVQYHPDIRYDEMCKFKKAYESLSEPR